MLPFETDMVDDTQAMARKPPPLHPALKPFAKAVTTAEQALVVEDGLAYSLLGMSYLGRLSAFEATPRGLTLKP